MWGKARECWVGQEVGEGKGTGSFHCGLCGKGELTQSKQVLSGEVGSLCT